MREYQRSSGRERKPAGRFGGGFGASKPRGSYGRDRDSNESSGYRGRSEGRFKRDSFSSDRQPPEMHEVVCDKCGKETTVPFKPTGSKPVYCRDCFGQKDSSFSKPRAESRDREDSPDNSSGELAKINEKLDKIMQALKIE